MELRHLRYFVGVAEARSFTRAARHLRVAQPALSKQVRDLEAEVGVPLFQRLPRGVRLTPAGEAFLSEVRGILAGSARALQSARAAAEYRASHLHFAHGEVAALAPMVEELLAAFHHAHPDVQVRVASQSDAETYSALAEGRVDVGCVFLATWPAEGFQGHRLRYSPATGVLLPASHPLGVQPSVRLQDLGDLTWLHSAPQRWPGFMRTFEDSLRDRGLVLQQRRGRPVEVPSENVPIAAGEAWALAGEAMEVMYRSGSGAIVYRPFVERPIPCWLALVWVPPTTTMVQRLVDVARAMGLP